MRKVCVPVARRKFTFSFSLTIYEMHIIRLILCFDILVVVVTYLSGYWNIFIWLLGYIYLVIGIYLSGYWNIFIWLLEYIYLVIGIYLSGYWNIFIWLLEYIYLVIGIYY